MSYRKAMKHARNVRKCKKQANNYMGFDTGSGRWPSIRSHPICGLELQIAEWFRDRKYCENKQYVRECIREAIAELRIARKGVPQNGQ